MRYHHDVRSREVLSQRPDMRVELILADPPALEQARANVVDELDEEGAPRMSVGIGVDQRAHADVVRRRAAPWRSVSILWIIKELLHSTPPSVIVLLAALGVGIAAPNPPFRRAAALALGIHVLSGG